MKNPLLYLWQPLVETWEGFCRFAMKHHRRIELTVVAIFLVLLASAERSALASVWRWSREQPQCYIIDLALAIALVAWFVSRLGSRVAGELGALLQTASGDQRKPAPPFSRVWRTARRFMLCCLILILLGEAAYWKREELTAQGDWLTRSPQVYIVVLIGICVVASYWLSRRRSLFKSELQESHYERFRRLEGLFNALPPAVRNLSTNRATVQEFQRQLAALEEMVDSWTHDFGRNDAADFVHSLHLVFLQLAPVDHLHFSIKTMESDYRQAAGPTFYDAYVASAMRQPTDPPLSGSEYERFLRADATFLANETRRQELLKQHAESTRQVLLRAAFRSWWLNTIPLLGVVVVYMLCQVLVDRMPPSSDLPEKEPTTTVAPSITGLMDIDGREGNPGTVGTQAAAVSAPGNKEVDFEHYFVTTTKNPGRSLPEHGKPWQYGAYTSLFDSLVAATLLALSGIAGVTGGLVSVVQRVQTGVPDSDPGTDLRELNQAESAVFFAPVTGLIFAVVLSGIFAGSFVIASLFPTLPSGGTPWYYLLWSSSELPKWLLWAFIAGFSERLVPDMLDRFAEQAKQAAKNPSPAGVSGSTSMAQSQKIGFAATSIASAASTVTPSLYQYKDAIPPDATEITVTGENFDEYTQVFVNNQPKLVLDTEGGSLRIALDTDDLVNRKEINLSVKNPRARPSDSNTLTITIGEIGG